MSTEETLSIFHKHAGSITEVIDAKEKGWLIWMNDMEILIDTNILVLIPLSKPAMESIGTAS